MRVVRRLRPFWLALILVATLTSPYPGLELFLPDGVAELTRPTPAYAVLPYIEQDNLRDPRIATQFRGISSPLALSADGRFVVVTGHLRCNPDPPGEMSTIQITLVQPATGAVGQGQALAACTGARNSWTTQLVAMGPATFLPGPVQACAVATGATPTRRVQWCRDGGAILIPIGPPPGPPPVLPVPVPVVMPFLAPMPVPPLPLGLTSGPAMVAPMELPASSSGVPAPTPTPTSMPAGAAPTGGSGVETGRSLLTPGNDTTEGAGPPGPSTAP